MSLIEPTTRLPGASHGLSRTPKTFPTPSSDPGIGHYGLQLVAAGSVVPSEALAEDSLFFSNLTLLSRFGPHQALRPSSDMPAGTRYVRTTIASNMTASPMAKPKPCCRRLDDNNREPSAPARIRATAVMMPTDLSTGHT